MPPETNGPKAAQEYRERNPQVAPQPPRNPLSVKAMCEMYMGKRSVQMASYKTTMPERDWGRFRQWVTSYMLGAANG